ncbi:hypothetical protein GGTG_10655 [Gaeumannomyces tritici R3-111a-1]|uniref:Uncharacterized protein n=1 Tax=Gaeumannomyces tritici (strain R3-111a-1) TaxID=644352 RepID=J3PAY0_GAET3|nr:hypothetical protein GGTG_10655 [Gaeumannomyces tritici R3-111a-1]EJT71396.1 hypothetical protein GGTG_10655 [Gaeumannomyces tritici R3-111a-1]
MPFLKAEAAIRRFQAQHNLPIRGAEVLDDTEAIYDDGPLGPQVADRQPVAAHDGDSDEVDADDNHDDADAEMAELADEIRLKELREEFQAGRAAPTQEELNEATEDVETREFIRAERVAQLEDAVKTLKDIGQQDSIIGKGLTASLDLAKHRDIEQRRKFNKMKRELRTWMYTALDDMFKPSIEASHTRMHEIMLAAIPGLGPVFDDMLEDIKSNEDQLEDQLVARFSERANNLRAEVSEIAKNMRAEVRAEMSEMSEIVKNMRAEMQVELRQTGAGDSQRLATLENRVALLVHREGRNGRRLENINEAIDRKLDRFERKLDSIERRLDSLERKA